MTTARRLDCREPPRRSGSETKILSILLWLLLVLVWVLVLAIISCTSCINWAGSEDSLPENLGTAATAGLVGCCLGGCGLAGCGLGCWASPGKLIPSSTMQSHLKAVCFIQYSVGT